MGAVMERPGCAQEDGKQSGVINGGMNLTLVEPDVRYREAFQEMAEEFHAASETYYEEELTLIRANFPAFVERLRGFARGEGLPHGYIPSNEFWLLDESSGKILGTIRLRHQLT